MTSAEPPVVIGFGGNALQPDPADPSGAERRAEELAEGLALLHRPGRGLLLVHGNGPQVGTLALRVEATAEELGIDPLDVLDAQTQGSIGYLLARAITTVLAEGAPDTPVAAIVTQVRVDLDDPAFADPTKPIGPYYSPAEADTRRAAGWDLVEVPGKGWRRVVASPRPLQAIEQPVIESLLSSGAVVIAGGGGGVPVVRDRAGRLHGVEAVIDKDRTAAMLAIAVGAAEFVIFTNVDAAYEGFDTDGSRRIEEMSVRRARELLVAGEFPAGSMGPKIEACATFAEATGRPAVITSVEARADDPGAGTRITP